MSDFVFDKIKDSLLNIDPVAFCEKHLTLDGKPFRIRGNGYKPFADIYRYIGIKALEEGAKPVVITKSRQVGATTMAAALEMYFVGSGLFGTNDRPPIRIVHAFPQLDLAASYSKTKLNSMIFSSNMTENLPKNKPIMQSLLDSNSPTNDSLQFKQFIGGNHIWIESVGIEGTRLRGRTADILFFDEVQEMYASAIGNSTKILNKAQYGPKGSGVQVFFGTPKQRGSEFSKMWDNSSQQYYYLGCEKCKKHFPLYTPNSNDWQDIWIYGFTVRCTHCGFEQNKLEAQERGKWVAIRDAHDAPFVGFHINQLYMPEYSLEKLQAEMPGKSSINTERTYQNEVLGEFFQGEATIITSDDIRIKCGDPERKMISESSDDSLTFLGIDIGAKADLEQLVDANKIKTQGQSYSTAVVLTVTGAGRLSIDFATKFKKNDLASKKSLVEEMMRRYSCKLAICDIGYANDFNEIMQTQYGDRFLSTQSSGRVNGHIKYAPDIFPKIITFEKDYWIADIYEQMKKGNIRFPLGDYEKIAWLIQHCTSMEIKPSISRTGDITPHYVKGSTPNDGFMAMLNAYIAYKFYISDGFKNNYSANSTEVDKRPPVLGGYFKRF